MKLQFTALILTTMAGQGFGQSTKVAVDVYLNGHDDSDRLLGPGIPLASDLFKKIGVRMNWHSGQVPASRTALVIRTAEHAPASASPEALAASQLLGSSEREVTIYKDRLENFLANHRSLAGVATGYVLAHELAHAMQGVARHSESGILKAHWSDLDFAEMVFHKLAFTSLDAELIHRGLIVRLAGRSSETASQPKSGPSVRSAVDTAGK
jgi:hypothetical protein